MAGTCPVSALQPMDYRGTGSTLGEHLSMAWPANPRAGGLFSSHGKVSDSVYRQCDDSLGGQQSIFSTAMNMAAASRSRPGQLQPAMDPLAPPDLESQQSALNVYVETRRGAIDPLAPPALAASMRTHAAPLPLSQPRADSAVQHAAVVMGRTRFGGTAVDAADRSVHPVPSADVERMSFEIIEDEERVQDLIGHDSGTCTGDGGVAREGGSGWAGLCASSQDTGSGGAGKDTPQARSSPGVEEDHTAEYASCPGSCAPPERSDSVAAADDGLPLCPRSPGGSAQLSAARAGAGVAAAGQAVEVGSRAWPNVRALAAKVRQRVDSETADIVRKCAVGAQHFSLRLLVLLRRWPWVWWCCSESAHAYFRVCRPHAFTPTYGCNCYGLAFHSVRVVQTWCRKTHLKPAKHLCADLRSLRT